MTERVPLIDAFPALADTLSGPAADVAARISASVLAIRRGRWDAPADAAGTDGLGFMVLAGTIARFCSAEHREAAELLGTGDLVDARDEPGVSWRALEPTQVVPLDLHLLSECAHVPALADAVLHACIARAGIVSRQLVIVQWSSVDERIVTVLGILADRWGVMTRDGIVLPQWLTHSVIAPLVGARRPSVTTALKRLETTGQVTRRSDGRWLLGGA